jgi:AcrR family transcriptional regulator
MKPPQTARDVLLGKVITFAASGGIANKSLREIGAGVDSSHRMLLYHFGSRAGLLAAIVGVIEAQQRAAMAAMTVQTGSPREVTIDMWRQVSSPELRPFVRLFFEVFGLAAQGVAGTEALLASLTQPWLDEGVAAAAALGRDLDATAVRLGVAVSRGLLLDLLAGADPAEVDASYELFVELLEGGTRCHYRPA